MTLPRLILVVAAVLVASCDSANVEESLVASDPVLQDQIGKRSDKVDICHARRSDFKRIRVAPEAVDAHRRHGDALVGDPIPGLMGLVFDGSCQPERPECTCWTGEEPIFGFSQIDVYYQGNSDTEFAAKLVGQPYGPFVYHDFPFPGYQYCRFHDVVVLPITLEQAVDCVYNLLAVADSCVGNRCPENRN